jgi:hypothetical protein
MTSDNSRHFYCKFCKDVFYGQESIHESNRHPQYTINGDKK